MPLDAVKRRIDRRGRAALRCGRGRHLRRSGRDAAAGCRRNGDRPARSAIASQATDRSRCAEADADGHGAGIAGRSAAAADRLSHDSGRVAALCHDRARAEQMGLDGVASSAIAAGATDRHAAEQTERTGVAAAPAAAADRLDVNARGAVAARQDRTGLARDDGAAIAAVAAGTAEGVEGPLR
ncbi:hypothetical protein [Bosea sp. (in: a-proteobacteria)]|uniref:hypothetical protein n=1 Tax=Bosea sp. (in: a-proteobacteria) TaxID=1871050 RepID=UPI003F7085C7